MAVELNKPRLCTIFGASAALGIPFWGVRLEVVT
jgi:hypothetical protein